MKSSNGIAFTPWKSSSKVVALNEASSIRTLSADARHILARARVAKSPVNDTLPSVTLMFSPPILVTSNFKTLSSPKWHGHTSFNSFIFTPQSKINGRNYPAINPSVVVAFFIFFFVFVVMS